jgi:hypothetical protein
MDDPGVWTLQANLAEGVTADRKIRNRISLAALVLGVGLLWPFPLGAAVLMVPATFALVISLEDEFAVSAPVPATAK